MKKKYILCNNFNLIRGRKTRAHSESLQPSTFSLQPSESGLALIMVLWILVLLGIIALNYLSSSRWNMASTRNLKEETVSYYMALSGYNEAMNYLLSDKDPSFDFIDADGNFWTSQDVDAAPVTVTGKKVTENGEVEIKIVDEDSKLNINSATQDQLQRLFTYAGIPDDTVQIMVDSTLDWKDPNPTERLNGAKDEYYEGLDDPYKAKKMNFDVPEELALVRGVKPEYLYGNDQVKALLPLITTFGSGNININTVSKDMMTAMGVDEGTIEAILKQRSGESKGFRMIPPEFATLGFSATVSNNLRIEVTAHVNSSNLASRVTAIINRQAGTSGYKMQTLFWKETTEAVKSVEPVKAAEAEKSA